MKQLIIYLFSFLLFAGHLSAQQRTVQGVVLETDTQEPLQAATVSLLNENNGNMIGYALTDEKGKFVINTSVVGTFKVTVSFMGYKTQTVPAIFQTPMTFKLDKEMITLKEVQINPGRVWARQDTIHYDLSKFATSKDQHIKDVLRKLPGVNVEEDGQVRYNGKPISNFYVEGLDVTGGKYNQINNNLRANAVKSAEIIEHHQPIKTLQDKVFTDDVALNLKLNPDARSQWMMENSIIAGRGDEWLYSGSLSALQLGTKQQTLYNYKTNNIGVDLASEQKELATGASFERNNDKSATRFLAAPYISMPIAKSRVLFNQDHVLSTNRLFKMSNQSQLRFQLGYTYNNIHQESGLTNTYYSAPKNIYTDEQQEYHLRTNRLTGELNYENNTLLHYTKNKLLFLGDWNNGLANITGDQSLTQQIKNSQIEVKNYFSRIYAKEKYTLGINSFVRYSYIPSTLTIDNKQMELNGYQTYTDNSLYWLRKQNSLSFQMTARFRGELSSVIQSPNPCGEQADNIYRANNFAFSYTPQVEWEKGRIQTTLAAPIQWKELPNQSYTLLSVDPSLFIRYRFNNRWRTYLYGSISKSAADLPQFYPIKYRQDYRTIIQQSGIVPEIKQQFLSLYFENKNTYQEFFWTLTLNYTHQHRNLLLQNNYEQGNFFVSSVLSNNSANAYSLNTILSKGFYDWHLKTSIEFNLRQLDGEQINQNVVQYFRNNSMSITPRIVWTPFSFFETNYEATLGCNSSNIGTNTRLSSLWTASQRLSLNYGIANTEFQLCGEHFYNDISTTEHLNTFFADASISYKVRKWQFSLSARNLLNVRQYRYTTYSDVQSSEMWTKIRPREILFGVKIGW